MIKVWLAKSTLNHKYFSAATVVKVKSWKIHKIGFILIANFHLNKKETEYQSQISNFESRLFITFWSRVFSARNARLTLFRYSRRALNFISELKFNAYRFKASQKLPKKKAGIFKSIRKLRIKRFIFGLRKKESDSKLNICA